MSGGPPSGVPILAQPIRSRPDRITCEVRKSGLFATDAMASAGRARLLPSLPAEMNAVRGWFCAVRKRLGRSLALPPASLDLSVRGVDESLPESDAL